MATSYTFKIGNDTIPYSESLTVKIDNTNYDISLLSLRYHKKMFQPSLVEAKLQLKQNTTGVMKAPEMTALVNYFKTGENNVILKKKVDNTEVTIAQDYYVYKVSPEYKRSEKGQYVLVKLDIYSPDHKLTLDKYCRAYTNRKLATDIVNSNLSESDSILKKAGFKAETVDITHLKFLNYIFSNKDNKVEMKEFVQPYLVQYNESFYDFIARTANRCGEFFYYEGGKLFVGLNDFSVAPKQQSGTGTNRKNWVDIDRDVVLSYSFSQAQEQLVNTLSFYHDSLKSDDQSSSSAYTFNNEMPLDEYLGNILEKDSYTTTQLEFFHKTWWKAIPEAMSALATGGLPSLVAWAVPTFAMGLLFAGSTADTKNKTFNDKWVSKDGKAPDKNPTNHDDRFDSSTNKVSLFGSQLSNDVKAQNYDYNQDLNLTLYNFIGNGSKTVSENLINISIPVEHTTFLLGQDVTFESKTEVSSQEASMKEGEAFNFKHYIIIEVTEVFKAEERYITQEDWQLGQKVTIAPLYDVKTKKHGSTDETFQIACPPVMCPLVKTSGTQRAIISNAADPQRYGRVQITYPWQNKSVYFDSSPFIRQAVPYVPNTDENGGGFYFQLGAGTEVLVDYENGNIERPYVIGCLYSKNNKAPRALGTYTGDWVPSLHPEEPSEPLVIASKKGHKIRLDDNGNLEDFLMGASPAIELSSMLWKKIIPSDWRLDQDCNSAFTGGISISDKWGLYKIACSSTKRSVSVCSTFGSVSINAFTGITIDCPNGNITLRGKNIKLEAGNDISIQSGLNINPPGYSTFRDTVLKGAANAIVDKFVLPMVDFRLLRTVLEIILKPAAGTMNIKSNRYLLLGAGLGKPEIPTAAYSDKGLKMKVYENERGRLHRQLSYMNTTIDSFFSNFIEKYKVCRTDINRVVSKTKKSNDEAQKRKDFVDGAYAGSGFERDHFQYEPFTDILHKQAIVDDANATAKKIVELKKTCEDTFVNCTSLRYGLDGAFTPGSFKKILAKEGKKAIPQIIQDVIDKNEYFDKPDITLQNLLLNKRAIKRYLMYQIIVGTYGVEYVAPVPGMGVTFNGLDDYYDTAKWLDWVNNLRRYTGKSISGGPLNQQEFKWKEIHKWGWAKIENGARKAYGPTGKFFTEVLDESMKKVDNYNPINAYKEKDIWGPGQKGEILMSDKSGHDTINIVNGALNRTENSDGYTNKIKALLSTIY